MGAVESVVMAQPPEDVVSLEGPVEELDGELILRIPLSEGGDKLVSCTRSIAHVGGDCLNIVIPKFMADKIGIVAGSQVAVHNRDGRFHVSLA